MAAQTGVLRRGLSANLKAYMFILPYLAFFSVFILAPLIYGFYLSFVEWDLFTDPEWAGLKNYKQLLYDDNRFTVTAKNTVTFVAETVPLLLIVPLLFALILNRPFRGRTWAFVAFVSISFLPSVPILWMWGWMLETQSGMINYYLDALGLAKQAWLSDPGKAMWTLSLITVWWTSGFNTILLLAGLQDIPSELYEAAEVDGASRLSRFRFITLPLLRDKLVLVGALAFIGSFKMFDQAYILTNGGPMGRTRTLTLYLYDSGFRDFRIGKAAAISWLMFAMMFVFVAIYTYLNWRGMRRQADT